MHRKQVCEKLHVFDSLNGIDKLAAHPAQLRGVIKGKRQWTAERGCVADQPQQGLTGMHCLFKYLDAAAGFQHSRAPPLTFNHTLFPPDSTQAANKNRMTTLLRGPTFHPASHPINQS
jgi:hypothetical protein